MQKEKIAFCWSGGKDSALALWELHRSVEYEVTALITTCTEDIGRISMHGVRCALVEQQAAETGLPLIKVFISQGAGNPEYEQKMHAAFLELKSQGIHQVAFGDLYLEEIRQYRDRLLAEIGMSALYPLWGKDTRALAWTFVHNGFSAVLVCVDPRTLDRSFAGRFFDDSLLADLPAQVDPCGENGEFHTFVFKGPIFRRPIPCTPGEVLMRNNFYYSDLLPVQP